MTAPLSVARLPPRRRRRLGLVVLVVLFALFLLLFNLVPLAAEWLWFQALGYERVFTTRLVPEAVRRDGPRVWPRRGLLRVHGAGDRGCDRSRHRRHDADAARDHHAVRAAPGHRRVPPAGHGGAIGPPAPGGANRPALRAGSVAGVLRPTPGTAVLHHRAARGGELRRSPRPAQRPAARPAHGRGERSAGAVVRPV